MIPQAIYKSSSTGSDTTISSPHCISNAYTGTHSIIVVNKIIIKNIFFIDLIRLKK